MENENNLASRNGLTDSMAVAMCTRIVAVWICLAMAIFATIYMVAYQEKLQKFPGVARRRAGENRHLPGAGHPGHPAIDILDKLPHTS